MDSHSLAGLYLLLLEDPYDELYAQGIFIKNVAVKYRRTRPKFSASKSSLYPWRNFISSSGKREIARAMKFERRVSHPLFSSVDSQATAVTTFTHYSCYTSRHSRWAWESSVDVIYESSVDECWQLSPSVNESLKKSSRTRMTSSETIPAISSSSETSEADVNPLHIEAQAVNCESSVPATETIEPVTEPKIPTTGFEPDMPTIEPAEPDMPATEPSKPDMPATEPSKPDMPATEPSKPDMPATEPSKPDMPATEPSKPDMPTTKLELQPVVESSESEMQPSIEHKIQSLTEAMTVSEIATSCLSQAGNATVEKDLADDLTEALSPCAEVTGPSAPKKLSGYQKRKRNKNKARVEHPISTVSVPKKEAKDQKKSIPGLEKKPGVKLILAVVKNGAGRAKSPPPLRAGSKRGKGKQTPSKS